ncbi:MAG: hypothetical protein IJZ91_09280 [Oscillospiraceae bacterium]|nr:hypothetical protein [Oscillospiraceae bacterium]
MGKHQSKRHGTARSNKYKASIISALLVLAMFSTLAMAEEWDISKGDVIVNATTNDAGETVQTVTGVVAGQETESTIEDSAPVITGTSGTAEAPADNTVTITVDNGAQAEVGFTDLKITTESNGADFNVPVVIEAGANATGSEQVTITLEGDNSVSTDHTGISSAVDTVIQGDGTLEVNANLDLSSDAAYYSPVAVGIDMNGTQSPDLTIKDAASVSVNATAVETTGSRSPGAVGIQSSMGSISVQDTAKLNASVSASSDSYDVNSLGVTGTMSVTAQDNSQLNVTASGTATDAKGNSSTVSGITSIYVTIEDEASAGITVNSSSATDESSANAVFGLDMTISGDSKVDINAESNSGGDNSTATSIQLFGELLISDSASLTTENSATAGEGKTSTSENVVTKVTADSTATINGTKVSKMEGDAMSSILGVEDNNITIIEKAEPAPEPEPVPEPTPETKPTTGIRPAAMSSFGTEGMVSIRYTVVEGKNAQWTLGSETGLVFELSHEGIVRVEIDGVEVEAEIEGFFVTISAEVLDALEEGEHSIEFIYADGSASTALFVK